MKRYDANVFFPGCLGPLKREVVLADDADKLEAEAQSLREEVAALRARVVVMPDRVDPDYFDSVRETGIGWNACLDELARLNGKAVSEGLLCDSLRLIREYVPDSVGLSVTMEIADFLGYTPE